MRRDQRATETGCRRGEREVKNGEMEGEAGVGEEMLSWDPPARDFLPL